MDVQCFDQKPIIINHLSLESKSNTSIVLGCERETYYLYKNQETGEERLFLYEFRPRIFETLNHYGWQTRDYIDLGQFRIGVAMFQHVYVRSLEDLLKFVFLQHEIPLFYKESKNDYRPCQFFIRPKFGSASVLQVIANNHLLMQETEEVWNCLRDDMTVSSNTLPHTQTVYTMTPDGSKKETYHLVR